MLRKTDKSKEITLEASIKEQSTELEKELIHKFLIKITQEFYDYIFAVQSARKIFLSKTQIKVITNFVNERPDIKKRRRQYAPF